MSQFSRIAAAAVLVLVLPAAQAITYSNVRTGRVAPPGVQSVAYGQVFNLKSDQQLESWSFFAIGGHAQKFQLVIADWDGAKAVGPVLYGSSALNYGGTAQTLGFDGISLKLAAGDYISYVTVEGVQDGVGSTSLAYSSVDGGLGGGFVLNALPDDPLNKGSWFSFSVVPNLQYSATFSPVSAVPEPSTYALLMLGLGGIGWAARRQRRAP